MCVYVCIKTRLHVNRQLVNKKNNDKTDKNTQNGSSEFFGCVFCLLPTEVHANV